MIYDLQKASLLKRASAFLFDFIIFSIIAVGMAALMSFLVGYDAQLNDLDACYKKYESEYGIDMDISEEDFVALEEHEKEKYKEAEKAFSADPEITRVYSMIVNSTLLIVSISMLVSFLLSELLVPLVLKNGQTIGKKIFGIALVRTDRVKVSAFQIFVRTVLGKFTIETMIPALLLLMLFFGIMGSVALIVIVLIAILEVVVMIASHTNSMIHDVLAVTVAVDMQSQMIFESNAELIEFKKRSAEQVAREKPY